MRLNSDHHELILNFAEKNTQIITNRWVGLGSHQDLVKLWDLLTTQLNSLGYGNLTTNEYKRRLTDWKSKTKAKASEINKSVSKTGGGPASEIKLSNHESRLLALMGNKSYEGDSVKELGVKNVSIPSKKYKTLEIQNQSLTKRKMLSGPPKGPVFPPPVFQPLFTGKSLSAQTSSPPQKKQMYNYQVEFDDIEVFDEIEVPSEVLGIDETEYIDNPEDSNTCQVVNQEHTYANNRFEKTTKTKPSTSSSSTSTRRRNKVLNLSKDIQNMNNESLSVLKEMNDNLLNVSSSLTSIGENISKLTEAVCIIAKKNNF